MNSQLIIRDGDVDHAYNCANGFVSRCVAAVHVENHSDARKLARILNDHFQSALSKPAPVAANASAEVSKFANDLAAKQEPLGVQISAEDLESTYIRSEPSANASAEVCALREKLSAALAGGLSHKSDCAVYLAPAYEPRECDCGAKDASAEARLREALNVATNMIMANAPGDSRAVSDIEVALCAASCGDLSEPVMAVIREVHLSQRSTHPHASDCDKQKECCDLAAKEPCSDCPFPNPDAAMRGLTDLERTLLIASKAAQNYIANTESELGMTLKSGELLRAAIAKAEACEISTHHHASDCDKQGER